VLRRSDRGVGRRRQRRNKIQTDEGANVPISHEKTKDVGGRKWGVVVWEIPKKATGKKRTACGGESFIWGWGGGFFPRGNRDYPSGVRVKQF